MFLSAKRFLELKPLFRHEGYFFSSQKSIYQKAIISNAVINVLIGHKSENNMKNQGFIQSQRRKVQQVIQSYGSSYQEAKQQMSMIFQDGIHLDPFIHNIDHFNGNSRMNSHNQHLITFYPFSSITHCIFEALSSGSEVPLFLYGSSGISKSLSIILYQILSNNIISYKLHNWSNQSKDHSEELFIPNLSKIIYWNVDLEYDDQSILIQKLLRQCTQLDERTKQMIKQHTNQGNELARILQQVKTFYNQRKIKLSWVINRVDKLLYVDHEEEQKIASHIEKRQFSQLKKYTNLFNIARFFMDSSRFSKVIEQIRNDNKEQNKKNLTEQEQKQFIQSKKLSLYIQKCKKLTSIIRNLRQNLFDSIVYTSIFNIPQNKLLALNSPSNQLNSQPIQNKLSSSTRHQLKKTKLNLLSLLSQTKVRSQLVDMFFCQLFKNVDKGYFQRKDWYKGLITNQQPTQNREVAFVRQEALMALEQRKYFILTPKSISKYFSSRGSFHQHQKKYLEQSKSIDYLKFKVKYYINEIIDQAQKEYQQKIKHFFDTQKIQASLKNRMIEELMRKAEELSKQLDATPADYQSLGQIEIDFEPEKHLLQDLAHQFQDLDRELFEYSEDCKKVKVNLPPQMFLKLVNARKANQ